MKSCACAITNVEPLGNAMKVRVDLIISMNSQVLRFIVLGDVLQLLNSAVACIIAKRRKRRCVGEIRLASETININMYSHNAQFG